MHAAEEVYYFLKELFSLDGQDGHHKLFHNIPYQMKACSLCLASTYLVLGFFKILVWGQG